MTTANWLNRVHLWLAIAWIFPGIPIGWWITYQMEPPHALFAVLLISLWANFVSHLGAMGAARAEEKAEETTT